jgi:parvulin-like peptidyl-prolyl isomerase
MPSESCETVTSYIPMKVPFVISRTAAAAALGAVVLIPVVAQNAAPPGDAPATAAPETASQAELELKDPVAVVNGENISKAELQEMFNRAVASSGVKTENLSNEQKLTGYRQLLDDLIIDKLVRKESDSVSVTDEEVKKGIDEIKAGFPSEEAFQEQLKQSGQTDEKLVVMVRDGMKQRKWVEGRIGDTAAVSDDEAKKLYDENKADFEQPEMRRASHVLFMVPEGASEDVVKEKEAAAKAAAERAKKGEDFEVLAKELSEEPGAKERGGDLDFFGKEVMVPEFSEAAFAAKVGDITGPVRTQFGWHVIKVTDEKPAGTMTFEEVKPKLVEFLQESKKREAVQGMIKKLRDSAKVEINLPEPGTQQ